MTNEMKKIQKELSSKYSHKFLNVCDGERRFLEDLFIEFNGSKVCVPVLCSELNMTINTMSEEPAITVDYTVKIEINIRGYNSRELERTLKRIAIFCDAQKFNDDLLLC